VATGFQFDEIPASATIHRIETVASIESTSSDAKGKRADNTTRERRADGPLLYDSVHINYLPLESEKGKRQKEVQEYHTIVGRQGNSAVCGL
jgi:hypothetical protein